MHQKGVLNSKISGGHHGAIIIVVKIPGDNFSNESLFYHHYSSLAINTCYAYVYTYNYVLYYLKHPLIWGQKFQNDI